MKYLEFKELIQESLILMLIPRLGLIIKYHI